MQELRRDRQDAVTEAKTGLDEALADAPVNVPNPGGGGGQHVLKDQLNTLRDNFYRQAEDLSGSNVKGELDSLFQKLQSDVNKELDKWKPEDVPAPTGADPDAPDNAREIADAQGRNADIDRKKKAIREAMKGMHKAYAALLTVGTDVRAKSIVQSWGEKKGETRVKVAGNLPDDNKVKQWREKLKTGQLKGKGLFSGIHYDKDKGVITGPAADIGKAAAGLHDRVDIESSREKNVIAAAKAFFAAGGVHANLKIVHGEGEKAVSQPLGAKGAQLQRFFNLRAEAADARKTLGTAELKSLDHDHFNKIVENASPQDSPKMMKMFMGGRSEEQLAQLRTELYETRQSAGQGTDAYLKAATAEAKFDAHYQQVTGKDTSHITSNIVDYEAPAAPGGGGPGH